MYLALRVMVYLASKVMVYLASKEKRRAAYQATKAEEPTRRPKL